MYSQLIVFFDIFSGVNQYRFRKWPTAESLISRCPYMLQGPFMIMKHYIDVIMTTVASQSPASRLFTQLFIQVQIKENIKASRHWPLCGEFAGTGEFPAQRASNAENGPIWWRHYEVRLLSEIN